MGQYPREYVLLVLPDSEGQRRFYGTHHEFDCIVLIRDTCVIMGPIQPDYGLECPHYAGMGIQHYSSRPGLATKYRLPVLLPAGLLDIRTIESAAIQTRDYIGI